MYVFANKLCTCIIYVEKKAEQHIDNVLGSLTES